MEKLNRNEFMISNLRLIVDNNYSEIIKYVNSVVLQLFWRIGMILKNDTDKNNIDYHQNLLNEISIKLRPLFGSYMHIDQLASMKKFAEKHDSESMDKVFYFSSWSEISASLNNISADVISMQYVEGSDSGINPYCSKIGSEYFSGKDRIKFRKLFEPKKDLLLSFYDITIERCDSDVSNKILNEILRAQVVINYAVNQSFNSFIWDIGDAIIKSSLYFEESVSENTIDHCIKELNESSPTIFNKKQLSACIELAKQYRESFDFMNISDMVSWPYLKLLLKVNNKEKQFYIANLLLIEEMDLSTIKKNLSNGVLDKIFDGNILSEENNYKLVKITTEKEVQNYFTCYRYERKNQDYELQRILNFNIFKNIDLLEFIKNSNLLTKREFG